MVFNKLADRLGQNRDCVIFPTAIFPFFTGIWPKTSYIFFQVPARIIHIPTASTHKPRTRDLV